MTITLGGAYPLAGLGDLVRVVYASPASADRGIVNGIDIEATRSDKTVSVRQSLTLGEDTPNQWAKFRNLLPGDPLLAGVVAVVHGDGTATVDLAGGGSMRVRGSGSVGQSVWLRSGRIEGTAPALSGGEIEV